MTRSIQFTDVASESIDARTMGREGKKYKKMKDDVASVSASHFVTGFSLSLPERLSKMWMSLKIAT